jgi:hypothetical protein
MDRRAFLKRFGIGVSAALALASLPVSAIEGLSVADAAKRCACEYMRKVYNDWCRTNPGRIPTRLEAGVELFEAYEGELVACERFTASVERDNVRHLTLKATPFYPVGHGWTLHITASRERAARAHA